MQVSGGDIITKEKFDGKFKLHVEFRVPYMPKASGQGRGNSGVYLQGRYEVQVLDSYGLKSKDNDCGGIYTVAAPLVNACKAPTVWQSYDIDFTGAAVRTTARRPSRRVITVLPQRRQIHDNVRRSPSRQHHRRPGRRPLHARPDHAAGPRQPGAVPQRLARQRVS